MMADYKYVIVGAGLSGLTIAERIANELDEKVLVIEKRNHIGGNVYDFYDNGILIQKYGPHIYHTNDKKVHDYLSQFTEWNDYVHRVLSCVDGKLVPMPICIDTLNALYDLDLDEDSMRQWIDEHKEDINEVKSSEDVVLKNAGRDIYEKLFKNFDNYEVLEEIADEDPGYCFGSPEEEFLGYRTENVYYFIYDDEISMYGYSYTDNMSFEDLLSDCHYMIIVNITWILKQLI